MSKTYSDYMDEIPKDELYSKLLTFGFFSEKLPPIFNSKSFAKHCIKRKEPYSLINYDYIRYDTIRNINTPRQIGIPVPFAYDNLCREIRDNCDSIKEHFHKCTEQQKHVISRNHIHLKKDEPLFKMNYDDWYNSGSPKDSIQIGMKYVVKADISTCFPSIYTHSLAWALVGKAEAKTNSKNRGIWYNKIDNACRSMKSNETHGILIGPHSSNILSEIILCAIDRELSKKYLYVRNIDDYTCYVESREKAGDFIRDLVHELSVYDLNLNHNKTIVETLPFLEDAKWVREINSFDLISSHGMYDYRYVKAFLDLALDLMKANGENAAILNYAIKVLSNKELTENAKTYYYQKIEQLCLLYPYLIHLLDEYVFDHFSVPCNSIKEFSNYAFKSGYNSHNYEECCFSIYFAIRYRFEIEEISEIVKLEEVDSCVFKLLYFLYLKKNNKQDLLNACKKEAKKLKDDFDRNWLFVYEVLDINSFDNEWRELKKANISFIKSDLRN